MKNCKFIIGTIIAIVFTMASVQTVYATNNPPAVVIERPANGSEFMANEVIEFRGRATDLEDGVLSGRALIWKSDIDNTIGYGESFKCRLSIGLHLIVLIARDSSGQTGISSVFLEVKKGARKQRVKKQHEMWFTYVPSYGSFENLKGEVKLAADDDFKLSNGKLVDYRVAVYIQVNGRWWTKPYWEDSLTEIYAKEIPIGSWTCDITTGGIDEKATRIAAYIVPAGYIPPVVGGSRLLPDELEENALARVEANRNPFEKPVAVMMKPAEPVRIKITGMCYGPFRDNQNPDMGIFPTIEEIREDLTLASLVTGAIRTYGSINTPGAIPTLCEKIGIKCYPGAWLGKYKTENEKEIEALLSISQQGLDCISGLIVGNEVLLRRDMTEEELIAYIKEVKESSDMQVTTAEIWTVWIKHPGLADEVDFLMIHIHPYWEGIAVEKAAKHVMLAWKETKKAFPGKKIIIGETGWPSEGKRVGNAVPSPENQARFFSDFIELVEKEGIEYFWFELFDEKWKDKFEGKVGAYWGIYNSDGSLKEHIKRLVSEEASEGISRSPGKISKVKVKAPLIVYKDADYENAFQPSGWMGDTECVELDKACTLNPHSGKTCIRITFTPRTKRLFGSKGWSGIYWQYPLNNWGEYPGYELFEATRLTFWARGETGSEKSEFKTGGISDRKKPYKDSFGPISTEIVTLTKEWKKYAISLKGEDTSNVIGGFCWVSNQLQNYRGCTIYLDDIVFEPEDLSVLPTVDEEFKKANSRDTTELLGSLRKLAN